MSETYDGDPNADWAALTIPDDGDDEDAASVDVALETLADRTAYLLNRRHQSLAVQRYVKTAPEYNPSEWEYLVPATVTPSNTSGWQQLDIGSPARKLFFHLAIPHAAVLNVVDVKVQPYTSHSGVVGTLPAWFLYEIDQSTGLETLLATHTDPGGSLGTYQTRHSIQATGLGITISNSSKRYDLIVTGEAGANAHINLVVISARLVFDMLFLDEAGIMSGLDGLFLALKGAITFMQDGVAKPLRTKVNFIGATVVENVPQDRLDVTISGAAPSSALPQNIGTAAAGSHTLYSRDDHIHAHGNQAGGALHPAATTTVAGFMSATDKTRFAALIPFDGDPALLVAHDGDQTAGVEVQYARGDHNHPHETLPGGDLHAVVVASGDAGFMSGADKAKFDGLATVVPLADSSVSAPGSGIKLGSTRQLLVRTTEGMQHEASCQDAASGGTSKRIYDRIARLSSTTIAAQDVDLVLAAELPTGSAKWVARARVEYGAYDTITDDGAGGFRVATIKCVSGTITVLTSAANQIVGTDDDPGSTSIAGAGQFIRTASGKLQFRFTTGKTNLTKAWARIADLTLVEH